MSDHTASLVAMASSWQVLAEDLDSVMSILTWGSFVIVEYDSARQGQDAPYVQAAPGPHGWYVELESESFLPAGTWPLDVGWLTQTGWNPPDGSTDNWWQSGLPAAGVAELLLKGLRCARTCVLADLVSVRTGRFPTGPHGGQPSDDFRTTTVTVLAA